MIRWWAFAAAIAAGARVTRSVLLGADFYEDGEPPGDLPPLGVGRDVVLDRVIIDKNARIGDGARLVNEAERRARRRRRLLHPRRHHRRAEERRDQAGSRGLDGHAMSDATDVQLLFETHATTLDNEAGLASGHFDVDLSATGEEQARRLGERRRDDQLAAVFSSDLRRAFRTADIAFADRTPICTRRTTS